MYKESVEQGQRLGLVTSTAKETEDANISLASLVAQTAQTGEQMTWCGG